MKTLQIIQLPDGTSLQLPKGFPRVKPGTRLRFPDDGPTWIVWRTVSTVGLVTAEAEYEN